jgi:hypothetical protein
MTSVSVVIRIDLPPVDPYIRQDNAIPTRICVEICVSPGNKPVAAIIRLKD